MQLRWSVYLVSLSFFHFSEFFTTALYKPEAATYDCEFTIVPTCRE